MSQGIVYQDGKWYCVHNTTDPKDRHLWEMQPYEVKEGDTVVEKGVTCPKCHRLQKEGND